MDGVRLAAPTVLNVKADAYTSGGAAAKAPAELPVGVLLIVAQGGHRIAFHHPPSTESPNIHGFDPQVLANLLLTNSALFEQLFDLTVGEIRLVGWPLSLQDVVPVAVPLRKPKMEDETTSESRLRALNVIFVLRARPEMVGEARYEHALVGCRIAAHQLARAFQREEAIGSLVTSHVALGRTWHGGGRPAAGAGGGQGGGPAEPAEALGAR